MRRHLITLILLLVITPCFAKNTSIVILGQSLRKTDKQEYIATTLNLINESYKEGKKYILVHLKS